MANPFKVEGGKPIWAADPVPAWRCPQSIRPERPSRAVRSGAGLVRLRAAGVRECPDLPRPPFQQQEAPPMVSQTAPSRATRHGAPTPSGPTSSAHAARPHGHRHRPRRQRPVERSARRTGRSRPTDRRRTMSSNSGGPSRSGGPALHDSVLVLPSEEALRAGRQRRPWRPVSDTVTRSVPDPPPAPGGGVEVSGGRVLLRIATNRRMARQQTARRCPSDPTKPLVKVEGGKAGIRILDS